MKTKIAMLVVLAALVVAPTAQAHHVPYLGFGEAKSQIGNVLHGHFEYGAVSGSLRADCWRVARNRVRCYISFLDADYDEWCGIGKVRENRAYYSRRYNVDPC